MRNLNRFTWKSVFTGTVATITLQHCLPALVPPASLYQKTFAVATATAIQTLEAEPLVDGEPTAEL